MALEAQVVGTWGTLEGDPQLRGHFGRIPFDFVTGIAKARGDLVLASVACAAIVQLGAATGGLEPVSAVSGKIEQVARARGELVLVDDASGDVENC